MGRDPCRRSGWYSRSTRSPLEASGWPVPILLEACLDSADLARAAERGGAGRIELCDRLDVGGTTPNAELIRDVLAAVKIPVFAMVRPRGGDFVYSEAEFDGMRRDAMMLKGFGVAGLVVGVLSADDTIDAGRLRQLVAAAGGLPVTFHLAFERVPDRRMGLETLIDAGVDRLLTKGGGETARDGVGGIRELVAQASGRIVIMAGGNVREQNVEEIVRLSAVNEIHTRGAAVAAILARANGAAYQDQAFGREGSHASATSAPLPASPYSYTAPKDDSRKIVLSARIGLTLLLIPLSLHALKDPQSGSQPPLLGGIDLAIHEFGHMFFRPFGWAFLGETMVIAGGALWQIAFPLIFAGYFLFNKEHRDRHAATVALWWSALNMVDVSVYMGDARARVLTLISGLTGQEDDGHDFFQLFSRYGMLDKDTLYAGRLLTVAGFLMFASIAGGLWFAWKGIRKEADTPQTP